VTGVTDWVAWASVLSTSESSVVLDAYAVVAFIKLSMIGTVVTVTIFWAVTVVGFHTVGMTYALVDRAIFSTPVFVTYTSVIYERGVLHTFFAIAC